MPSIDFSTASGEAIIAALGQRLEGLRLSRNITQAELAERAGVSRSTLTRLAEGRGVSLDSFVRVMRALGLADHLAALLPDPSMRPVERLRFEGKERKRASHQRKPVERSGWRWGDEEGER
jgi:transcriptional regulator with XRE-family HTH domain